MLSTHLSAVRMEKADGSISAGKHAAQVPPDDDGDEDTFVSRFVTHLLKWIMQGFLARDKNVRYRSLFLVSEMVLWLGELEQVFTPLARYYMA
jgi:condensin complex subunit 3